jgi:hypothetical protein
MATRTPNVAKAEGDRDLECQSHATQVEELAPFVCRSRCDEISGPAGEQLKLRVPNSAPLRYLDLNDCYLAPGETCHPSDNLAPVLAAAEYAPADGRTLTALAVAYPVQDRLCEVTPVRAKGLDHPTQGACAVAAGPAQIVDAVTRLDEQDQFGIDELMRLLATAPTSDERSD